MWMDIVMFWVLRVMRLRVWCVMMSGGGKWWWVMVCDVWVWWCVVYCVWMVVVVVMVVSVVCGWWRWRWMCDDVNVRDEMMLNLMMLDVCLYLLVMIECVRLVLLWMVSMWWGMVSVVVLVDLKMFGDVFDLSAMASELEGDAGWIVIMMVEVLLEYENRFLVNFLCNLVWEKCVVEFGVKYVLVYDVDFEVFVAFDEDAFLNDVRNVLGKWSGEKVCCVLVVLVF